MNVPHISVHGVSKTYALGRAHFGGPERFVLAVDHVSLDVQHGKTLGLVGESGCGKSTLARLIMQLETPTAGSIAIEGEDFAHASNARIKAARRRFQMIFQDPYSSLNPQMTARAIIAETLSNYRIGDRAQIEARVEELAALRGLSDYHLDRYPHRSRADNASGLSSAPAARTRCAMRRRGAGAPSDRGPRRRLPSRRTHSRPSSNREASPSHA